MCDTLKDRCKANFAAQMACQIAVGATKLKTGQAAGTFSLSFDFASHNRATDPSFPLAAFANPPVSLLSEILADLLNSQQPHGTAFWGCGTSRV
jgi:hypothetical protein